MSRRRRVRNWTLALPALLPLLSAHAQATHPCAARANDAERLACYDAAFGHGAAAAVARAGGTKSGTTTSSVAPAPPVAIPSSDSSAGAAAPAVAAGAAVTTAPNPAAATATAAAPAAASAPPSPAASRTLEPEAAFGFNAEQKKQLVPETVKHEPEKRSSIESSVTIVSTRRTGEFVYTLANGQIWIQTEASQDGYLRDGSPVTIKRAALSSYKLVSGNVSTRVRRVQ
jgi:hypothetical protein